MARRQEGGEGQRVLWRLPDAQLNSGSSAMSTRAATPDCSGEGAMTSSYDTLYVRIRGVHRAVSMKCPIQVPIANMRFKNARGSRAFSDWSQVPISNVPSKKRAGRARFRTGARGWSRGAPHSADELSHQVPIANVPSTNARGSRVFVLERGLVALCIAQCR